jgi:hypothetical protein
MRAVLLAALLAACGRGPEKRGPRVAADDVLAKTIAVHFGGPIADLRAAHPSLAASGWQQGSEATWLDPTIAGGLEVTTKDDTIHAIAVQFTGDDANATEHDLYARLGPSVECAAANVDITGGYKPILWQTTDGGSVSMMRKRELVTVRVEKPASAAFEAAWKTCR